MWTCFLPARFCTTLAASMKLPEAFALLRKFAAELPAKLTTGAARAAAVGRVHEMENFFQDVRLESFNGESL